MLAIILAVLAVLLISTANSGARLESKVLTDIERGTYEETPGTAKIVQRLRLLGVVTDDADGRMTVNADARAARTAASRTQRIRLSIIVISLAGLTAVAIKLLLDRAEP